MTPVYLFQNDLNYAQVTTTSDVFEAVMRFGAGEAFDSKLTKFKQLRDTATKKRQPLGDFASLGGLWFGLVSPRGQQFLRRHTKNARILNVDLTGGEDAGYALYSIDEIVEGAVDSANSVIDIEPSGMWRSIHSIVFNRDMDEFGIFRLRELRTYTLCTEKVLNDYKVSGLNGLKFAEVFPVRRAPVHWYDCI